MVNRKDKSDGLFPVFRRHYIIFLLKISINRREVNLLLDIFITRDIPEITNNKAVIFFAKFLFIMLLHFIPAINPINTKGIRIKPLLKYPA